MYHEYSLNLTENQKNKFVNAYKDKTDVKIRLSNVSLQLKGNVNLNLTSQQINRISKARISGHGVDIKFSKTQLKKQEGFLSGLLNLGKLVLLFLAKKVITNAGISSRFRRYPRSN